MFYSLKLHTILPLILLTLLGAATLPGCSDDGDTQNQSGNDTYGNDSTYGYVEMEEPTIPKLSYLGMDGSTDYDAKCVQEHGDGYLSFLMLDEDNAFACFESCKKTGSNKGFCELVDNVHYGMISINTVYNCEEVDGKKIYLPSEYQHCNHDCNESKNACD